MINRLTFLSTTFNFMVNSEATKGHCVTCLAAEAIHGLCEGCREDLPLNQWCCRMCALPLAFPVSTGCCGECLATPPPFRSSLIPWRYQFPVDGMIGRYKYHGQRKFIRPLLNGFVGFLEQSLTDDELPELIIPAPMHWARRWQRGFNQAQEIAEFAGAQLGVPVAGRLVRRRKRVRAQRNLDRNRRLKNLKGVFEVCAPVPARIAIVDDVVTTGATARALAAALERAGASEIQLWALARTPG
ncbi:ComF family protein [Marinobacter fuscus]|uniref:ComF family protein n=2 Tax=Marinobacter fuscus TaxID=2109942 RepID=A0A2T1K789_9GAMM|nr:ComF family protein [Marinobacter fuscus]